MAGTNGTSLYSFKDTSMSFYHPLAGRYLFSGKVGIGQFTIDNTTDRTQHNVSSDGAVMISYIAGDNGGITIECQQTSDMHHFLLDWFNIIKTAADAGDVSNWATAAIVVRSVTDNNSHSLSGVSPQKVPSKTYAGPGGMVTWVLMAAEVISE